MFGEKIRRSVQPSCNVGMGGLDHLGVRTWLFASRRTCMPPEGDCHAWVEGSEHVDSSKRTFPCAHAMSALPPKADMCGATRDVRFGPKADISARPTDVRFTPKSGHIAAIPSGGSVGW